MLKPILNDCFAWRLAEVHDGILMSGDGELRRLAADNGVEVHGALWAIELMLVHATCRGKRLIGALDALDADPLVRLTPDVETALLHGSSISGARPKAMIVSENRRFIAKFSLQNDLYNVVKAEFIAMRLAQKVGLAGANVRLERAAGRDVLLIERFDREKAEDGWRCRAMVSALTLRELDEMMARYASYEDLAAIIRRRFARPKETLKELYGRLVFNVLCGNTDDHARNHAAFWNGHELTLTPAYNICPQARTGGEGTQAMLIMGGERASQISLCLKAARVFLLDAGEAVKLGARQIRLIKNIGRRSATKPRYRKSIETFCGAVNS